jgi:hypothetical protein
MGTRRRPTIVLGLNLKAFNWGLPCVIHGSDSAAYFTGVSRAKRAVNIKLKEAGGEVQQRAHYPSRLIGAVGHQSRISPPEADKD